MLKKDSGIHRKVPVFLIFACAFLSVANAQEPRIRVRVSLGDVSLNKARTSGSKEPKSVVPSGRTVAE